MPPAADFAVTVQGVSAWTVIQQDLFYWYVTVTEVAGGNGTGPIQVTLPDTVSFGYVMPGGTGWSISSSGGARVLTYAPGLSAGQSSTIDIRLDALETQNSMTLTAVIASGSGGDSNTGNNTASASLTVPE